MSGIEAMIEAATLDPTPEAVRAVIAAAGRSPALLPMAAWLARLDPGTFDRELRGFVVFHLLSLLGARLREAAQGVDEPPVSWPNVNWLTRASGTVAAAALSWSAWDEDGEMRILRVRVLLAKGSITEAHATYCETLAAFPDRRYADLDREFDANPRWVAAGRNPVRLAVEAPAATETEEEDAMQDEEMEEKRPSNVVRFAPRGAEAQGVDAPAEPPAPRIDFAAIGGLEEVKAQIRRRIVLPFQRKGLFERFRKRAGGGVLLYGPPGCGKTLIARATAAECGARFTAVEIADVLDKYIGESEKRVAALFAEARAERPSVLFFDEVEALAARRRFTETSYLSAMVSTFLNEMDGFKDDNDGVLVLAATNTPWAIDAAFRRPGRFDRSLFIPPPDRASREAILAIELKDRPAEATLPLAEIAEKTSGFSGADLANVVETACDLAIERSVAADSVAPITAADLRTALKEVRPTTGEWLTQARNHARFANEGGFYDEVVAFLDKHGRR